MPEIHLRKFGCAATFAILLLSSFASCVAGADVSAVAPIKIAVFPFELEDSVRPVRLGRRPTRRPYWSNLQKKRSSSFFDPDAMSSLIPLLPTSARPTVRGSEIAEVAKPRSQRS